MVVEIGNGVVVEFVGGEIYGVKNFFLLDEDFQLNVFLLYLVVIIIEKKDCVMVKEIDVLIDKVLLVLDKQLCIFVFFFQLYKF